MKRWKRLLAFVLSISMLATMDTSMVTALAADTGNASQTVGNSIVQYNVANKNGRFTICTEDGIPEKKTDKNSLLLFLDRTPDTSFTTIRINNKDYIFGNDYGMRGGIVTPTTVSGKIAKTVWKADNVQVTQKLQLVTDLANPNVGNVKITYDIDNGSNATVSVGARILLDTQLGSNDASTMLINNQYITNETTFSKDAVPQMWQSSDKKFASNVVSYGYLSGWDNTAPDAMTVAHWNSIANTKWDYKANSLLNFTTSNNNFGSADSAVGLYYNPTNVAVGKSRTIETYYGIGNISDKTYKDQKYSVQINSPQKLSLNADQSGYTKDPFEVNVIVSNNTDEVLTDLQLSLGLSKELSMYQNGSTDQLISSIAAHDQTILTFKVRPRVQEETAVAQVGVSIYHNKGTFEAENNIVLMGKTGKIPTIQMTEVAPDTLYTKTVKKNVTIKGDNFNLLKADQDWTMECINNQTKQSVDISRADISIGDNTTMSVTLPGNDKMNYTVNDFTIQVNSTQYGTLSRTVHMSADPYYDRKMYGVMVIGKFEDEKTKEEQYGVRLFETEEEMDGMTKEEKDAVLLTIRGEVTSYTYQNKDYYSVASGAIINNCIKYINRTDAKASFTINRYEPDVDNVGDRFKKQFSGWKWWGNVGNSLVMTGNGTLYVGDYAFNTGDFYLCLEDDNTYELRGGELDDDDNNPDVGGGAGSEAGQDETSDVEIITPIGVIGSELCKTIGALTGFRVSVSNAVIGEETVSLGGSFEVELPWWSKASDGEDKEDPTLTKEQKAAQEKFDKWDDKNSIVESGSKNDSFVSLNMEEMRYGIKGDNKTDLVGVKADGSITLNDDSIPKFTKGGGSGSFEINSIDYPGWYIGVGAGVKVGDAFECEFNMALVKENGGSCYPDSVTFISGGHKIPLGSVGYLTKLGGGISGLYDTIKGNFNTFPPVSIHVISGYADPTLYSLNVDTMGLTVGGQGISFSAEEGKICGVKVLDDFEAHLLLYGYKDDNGKVTNCVDIGANIGINILGVVRGDGGIWIIYDPRIDGVFGNLSVGGKACCGVFIPDWLPIVGGKELSSVMVELSTYRVYAGVRIIGIPLSIAYYWSDGKVKFNDDWEYISEEFNIPKEDLENSLGVTYDSGDQNVDGVMLFGDNATKLKAKTLARTKRARYRYEVNLNNNDYSLIQAAYNAADISDGSTILDQVTLYDPDGNTVALKEEENALIQHIDADDSESGKAEDNLGIGLTAPKNGTWILESDVELDLTPYKVDEVASVEAKSAEINGQELSVNYAAANVEKGSTMDLYMAEAADGTEASLSGMKITDEPLTFDIDKDGNASGTVKVKIPDEVQDGKYQIRVVINDENGGAVCSVNTEDTLTYKNPNAPGNVKNVVMEPAGDGQYKISWDEVADADGYYVSLVDENGQAIEGLEGMNTTDTHAYLGGTYPMNVYQQDTDGNYVLDEDGQPVVASVKEVGTKVGENYKAVVYAYRQKDDTIYPSTVLMTQKVALPKSDPAGLSFKVNGKDVTNGTLSSESGDTSQVTSFQASVTSQDAEVTVTSDQDVSMLVTVDGDYGDYKTYELKAGKPVQIKKTLKEGGSVLGFIAKNGNGDYTENTVSIEVDSTPPTVLLENTVVSSTDGNYTIRGTVEANAAVSIAGKDIPVADGTFEYQGTGNTAKESIEIKATDRAGNGTVMNCDVVPSEITGLSALILKQDGEVIDEETGKISMKKGDTTSIELYGTTTEGKEVKLDMAQAQLSVLAGEDKVSFGEDGTLEALYPGESIISVGYQLTSDYKLEQTANVSVATPVINPATVVLSSEQIDVSKDIGTTVAQMTVPDSTENMKVTWSISKNDYLEVKGNTLVLKSQTPMTDNLVVTISGEGTYTDNDGKEQTFNVDKEFTFTSYQNIKNVEMINALTVKAGTTYDALDLPAQVKATTTTGEDVTCDVSWTKGAYTGDVVGNYNLKGSLVLPKGAAVTNENDKMAEVMVSVERISTGNKGKTTEVTYAGEKIDLSDTFTIDSNAGAASYKITGGTGKGTIDGKWLTVTKAGTFDLKLTTEQTDWYDEGTAIGYLTVKKGTQTKKVEGVQVTDVTTSFATNGVLNGLSKLWEYKTADATDWKAITETSITGLGRGSYEIRYAEDDLYLAGETATYQIKATNKEQQEAIQFSLSEIGSDQSVIYGVGTLTPNVSGGSGKGNVIYSSSDTNVINVKADGTIIVKHAGTAVITATKEADNDYNSISSSVEVTVHPKTLELTWSGMEERTYDGMASALKAKAVNLEERDTCQVILKDAQKVNAGTYTATAKETDNKDYKLPEDVTQEYTILPKEVSVSWDNTKAIYNGKELSGQMEAVYEKVDGTNGRAKVEAVASGNDKTIIPMINAGSYNVRAVSADGNYTVTENGYSKAEVEKAAPKVSVSVKKNTGIKGVLEKIIHFTTKDTFKITAKVNGVTGEKLSGTMEFFKGKTSLGKANVKNNQAVYSAAKLKVGDYDVRAEYVPDGASLNYYGATGENSLHMKKQTAFMAKGIGRETSVKMSWSKVAEADGYVIYGSACGTDYKAIKTLKGASKTSYTQKKLKKATCYKYYVCAYKKINGEKVLIKQSPKIHVSTTMAGYTTVKKIKTDFSSVALTVGQNKKVKATQVLEEKDKKVIEHMERFRYKTDDPKVAVVTDKGKIKAVGKGSCNIYVCANNGVYKKIEVTVK